MMFLHKLYQVLSKVVEQFDVEVRNQRVLLDLVMAMLASSSCRLEELARALQPRGRLRASTGVCSGFWPTSMSRWRPCRASGRISSCKT